MSTLAARIAAQGPLLVGHLPAGELPDRLQWRVFAGEHLLLRVQAGRRLALYTLNPQTGGADRITLEGGGSWITHYRDGKPLGAPEPYALPPELAALN